MACFKLGRKEIIRHKKIFDKFFREGKNVYVRGIKLAYYAEPCGKSLSLYPKVAFSVPKRLFPRAVDRNYLKRLMREAWRLNKTCFPQNQVFLFFIYQNKIRLSFKEIREAMEEGIVLLEKNIHR
jgi:ribonuclease P protein component